MMKIGVVGISGMWSSETLADRFEAETGFRCLVDMEQVLFDLEKGEVLYNNENLLELDALVIKKLGSQYSPDLLNRLEILKYLSEKGVRIFSKPESIHQVLDRMSCTVRLRLGKIPMPPTVITENKTMAMKTLRRFGKAVLKPLYTSKARGMMLLDAGNGAQSALDQYQESGNTFFYLQKWINSPGKDLGIAFLGGQYIGTYARVAKKDAWNTSTLSGGHYEPYEPKPELVDLAHKAQALFDLDFTCVDVVEAAEGPLVYEVSAFGGFKGLQETCGIDSAHMYANYVLEHMSHVKN